MKLVEILARELVEWPGGVYALTQSCVDAEIYRTDGNPENDHEPLENQFYASQRGDESHDCVYPLITREMWQAERERIAQKENAVKLQKPNKDGWIRHRGGKCPVGDDAMVEVRLRDGTEHTGDDAENGGYWVWSHSGSDGDIMAWRPHNPSILDEPGEPNKALNEVLELDAANTSANPIQWRDRIREIDASSKKEEARHCAAMKAYDEERADLVAKLKAEGFVLIQGDEPNAVVESAHGEQDIAQQDMSDPANWREGDVVEIVGSTNDGWLSRKGRLGNLDWDDEWRITFNGAEVWYVSDNTEVKWHSRPTT